MRLGYLVNQYPAPTHSFIRRELRAVEALGHEVRRYSIRRSREPLADAQDFEEARRTGVVLDRPGRALGRALAGALASPARAATAMRAATRWGAPSRIHALAYLAEAAALAGRWHDDGIDHVHVHFGTNSTTVASLARLLGGPRFSVTIHGDEPFREPWARGLRERLELAEAVFGISEGGVRRLRAWAPAGRVHRVRCGLDAAYLVEEPRPPSDSGPLLFVGSLTPNKGPDRLVDAALELLGEGRVFDTWLLGDGPLRGSLEERIRRSGYGERFRLCGWASSDEVRRAIVGSRCLVLPSRSEGLPVVVMEALACGRPVIATRVGSLDELVESESSGWLIPPDEPLALGGSLRRVLDLPASHLLEMGLRGRMRVQCNHDADREARELASVLLGPGA